jgi:hypothetical protein
VFAHDPARGGYAGEARVEAIAELQEERDRPVEILDRRLDQQSGAATSPRKRLRSCRAPAERRRVLACCALHALLFAIRVPIDRLLSVFATLRGQLVARKHRQLLTIAIGRDKQRVA